MKSKKDYQRPSTFIEIIVLAMWLVGFGVVYMLSGGWTDSNNQTDSNISQFIHM